MLVQPVPRAAIYQRILGRVFLPPAARLPGCPAARLLKDKIEYQTIGLFDRPMTFPIDFGS